VSQATTPYPELESVTQVRVATYSELEADLELDPVPSFDVNLYPIPDMGEPPVPASELLSLLATDFPGLGGGSPELVASDPFEYEITRQPLQPSRAARRPETNPLPEGPRMAVWSYLGPQALLGPRSDTKQGARASAESSLRVLAMEPTPATNVALKVLLDSDVLLQLLDQQMPHPDRLHALGEFAAHPSDWALPCLPPQQFESRGDGAKTALPAAAPVTADCQPASSTDLLRLSAVLLPAQGTLVSRTAISEIAIHPQMATSAILPAEESIHQMGMAGLQSLRSNLSRAAQAVFARLATGPLAFELSAGVSSDVTYPSLAPIGDVLEAPLSSRLLPLTFAKKRKAAGDVPRVEPIARLLPQAVEIHPVIPNSGLEPLDRKPPRDTFQEPENVIGSLIRGEGLGKLEPAWAHAIGFWHQAPRDLKLLLFAIPALLALVFHPGLPRIAFAAPKPSTGFTGGFTGVISDEWTNVRTTLENRAAVALDEDFRSGLDNWASPGGSTTEWSFDQTGFVRPGPLALYRPSVNLTDYHVEFVGLIDKKALSWVVRAADFENFYVIKLAIVKPGPMPVIGLTRYAVIGGKAQDRHDVNIPLDARADTVYNVRMDVQGSEFAVEVQGQIADSWTETRLPRGGVGFFTASGEASRLRWMQITHQYDMLGRLCAYLAPYDTTNGSWQP
jgi:hypothetical protein